MNRVLTFFKKETVLCVAWTLAIGTSVIVAPDKEYWGYIHWNTLATLFVLMLVMAGMKDVGILKFLGEKLLSKVNSQFGIEAALVFVTFFSAMLITNDVALLTFVPFAIEVLDMGGMQKRTVLIVAMQACAANLGAMLSPVGNPHNIYFYYLGNYSTAEFLKITTPQVALGFILLFGTLIVLKPKTIRQTPKDGSTQKYTGVQRSRILQGRDNNYKLNFKAKYYILVLLVMLFTLTKIINVIITAGVILVVTIFVDRQIFKKADYALLLTFAGFFVFVGNMQRIEIFQQILPGIIEGKELIMGVLFSQFMCNLPTSMLLSGFTTNYDPLIIATDIGGMGTIIASLANLIAYKAIAKKYPEYKGNFLKTFTVISVIYLILEMGLYFILN